MIGRSLFEDKGLSLDRLRSFLEVVESGSIARAAGQDANRQSQFSRQIKELEIFFGAELTRREGRRIAITEEGERLARIIRNSFTELSDFRADSQHEKRRLTIAAGASVIEWLLPSAFQTIRAELGGPLIEARHCRSAEVVRGLDDGRIDFGILRADILPRSITSVPIGTVMYRLFVPKELAPERRPNNIKRWEQFLEQLPQARLLGGRLRRAIDEAHQAIGVRPQVVAEMSSFLQIAALVRGGTCGAILPVTASVSLPEKDFKAFGLEGFLNYQRELYLVFNRERMEKRGWSLSAVSKIARAFEGPFSRQ